jgi:hypothetical protein
MESRQGGEEGGSVMSGKGDTRRPSRIAEREMARRWARAFGGAKGKEKKGRARK